MDSKVIEVAALGRPLHPGMLYDCRSDTFTPGTVPVTHSHLHPRYCTCYTLTPSPQVLYLLHSDTFTPGVSLWDEAAIKRDMSVKPQPRSSFHFTAFDSLSEKANLLDVSASLKASFLGGLVEVGGSASYLNDRASSMHQCRVTMQYKQTTEFKQLTMTQLGKVTYPQVFDQKTATHVVTAVLYGAEAFMVFDQMASDDKEKQDIKGNLDVMIKKIPLIDISGSGRLVMSDEEKTKVERFSCKFHGDFALRQNPSTYEEAVLVYKQLPKMLGEKGENAVPVRVWLYPLEKLDSKAAKLMREIEEKMVSEVEVVMEQLHEASMRANDLVSHCDAIKVTTIKDKLTEFQRKFKGYTLPLLHNLGKVLPAIRAGSVEEQKLVDILKTHHESPFNKSKMSKWLDGKESEIEVLRSCINTVPSVPIVSPGPQLDSILFSPKEDCVIMLSFTSLEYHEPYLSSLSEYPASESEPRKVRETSKAALPWYSDPKIFKRVRSVFKYAENLGKYFKEYKSIISYMSNTSSPGASVLVYQCGELVIPDLQDAVTLQVVSENINRVTLRVSPALRYRVEHRQAGCGEWTVTDTSANAAESLTVPKLRSSTEHQVRLTFTSAEGINVPGRGIQVRTKVPCVLKLTSASAVPIFVSPAGHVLLAAAQYGRGRIVVTSHEAYLEEREQLTASGRFIRNAISWLKPHPDDWVGVCGLGNLRDILCESGIKAKNVSSYDGTVGVFCRDAYTDSQADELLEFVRQGGGLLIGGQAWWWSYKNPGSDVQTSYPGNKLTGAAGIYFTDEYGEKGTFDV
ncbi:hypothetical protein JZ751_017061 [Albula glossodonta]|uniref:Fibronectin type-III domain-containing protein n=1 Tax=Albula glossodonta TaxID=121402 RepID=A0A8T2NPR5_9TELE|nr:hypothetical protein JZ751_017061 [Albula glossodonta]